MTEKGIDVSAHNGVINYPQVAASGVKGVVIRAGYGNDIRQADLRFVDNIKGAIAAGLKVAVYWFSYADSVADAQKEWVVCKQVIEPYRKKIKFVAFDYEYASYNYYKKVHGTAPSKTLINAMTNTFLNAVKADGYGTALYTNNDYRKNIFTAATLAAWRIWLADYSGKPDIKCFMQQTGSTGHVPGISGNVDMDTLFIFTPQTAVKIDTTMDVTKPAGDVYTFKVTCDKTPFVSIGNPKVAALFFCRRDSNDHFYHLFFCGKSGQVTGIYTAAPGEDKLLRFHAKVK